MKAFQNLMVGYLLIASVLFAFSSFAQERVKAGVLYPEGSQLVGPRSGIVSMVQPGWEGIIPFGSELFTLIPTDGRDGQIFVRAVETNEQGLKDRWLRGLELGEGILAKLDGDIGTRDDRLTGEFVFTGSTNNYRGYLEGKCGSFGICVVFSAIATPDNFDYFKQELQKMMDETFLEPPSLADIYAEFDWAQFLTGKYLVTFQSHVHYKKQNDLWLCSDGTFKSNLKRGGLARDTKGKYTGKNKGTWTANGVGAQGELLLTFKGEANPIPVPLEINEERIYLNGERYFAMEDDKCK